MSGRLATIGAALLVAAAAPSVASATRILLPSAHLQLQVTPPLRGSTVVTETRFPFKAIINTERVLVGIDAAGKPVSVDVVQRLALNGFGDYTFSVPGPITKVTAAAGSASAPGLRRGAILWSGFSSGRKLLAARANLDLAVARAALPLRLTIARDGSTLTVRGDDVSQLSSALLTGPSSPAATAAALDETRRAALRGPALQDLYVDVPAIPRSKEAPIAAPLRVTGELRLASGRTIPLNYVLGDDGASRSFVVRVRGVTGEPKVRLVVRPVTPSRLLTPPAGSKTWVEALRLGRVDPARLLEIASRARLTIARAIDYQSFLINPDPRGTSRSVYLYATTAGIGPAAIVPPSGSGKGWISIAVGVVLVVGAGGLVVLWAHH
jgi:hypothetical protein